MYALLGTSKVNIMKQLYLLLISMKISLFNKSSSDQIKSRNNKIIKEFRIDCEKFLKIIILKEIEMTDPQKR